MHNRQLIFSPKIPYDLVAERSEANSDLLTFPVMWTILKIVRTHFVPTAVADEGLAKNSACPPEVPPWRDEGGNRNPELKNCQRTPHYKFYKFKCWAGLLKIFTPLNLRSKFVRGRLELNFNFACSSEALA
ncbi:hypothetical protein KJ991_02495 [Patescibacteria group bacterium]|nr:hypothetical protein [Patescibacteria group bacterium]MBU4115853.1 hypothetical protein [Patescibacteria group bacterium]